jgi:L-serine/L-threonine ammonia-lyase
MNDSALHVDTPLISSPVFTSGGGQNVLFKIDALQPSGSFKLRGVGMLCVEAISAGATSIVCPSGGNAGYAAAYAGQRLGVPVVVVVPETTSEEAKRAIRLLGARVEVHGASFDEANVRAVEIADETHATYVHPFDDPRLWKGHASLIDEVVAAGASFDVVIASVGGGGLLLGILEGLRRNGLEHIPVVAVETVGADSLHRSLADGDLVTLPAITSIATSLGARRVASAAFEAARAARVISAVVSDRDAVEGCVRFADAHRILIEPASGAAVAGLELPIVRTQFARPLVEVCGGVGVSLDRLAGWRARLS